MAHSCFVCICRLSYWLSVPTVTPADLEQLVGKQPSDVAVSWALPKAASQRQRQEQQPHSVPAVEIGTDKAGQLTVLHHPNLHSPMGSGSKISEQRVEIGLDWRTLSAEDVLLRAAEANAAIQLGVIFTWLSQEDPVWLFFNAYDRSCCTWKISMSA